MASHHGEESFSQRNTVSIQEMMDFEDGNLTGDALVAMFQKLINTGLAWRLQGFYGRTAKSLIGQGLCHEANNED